MELKKATYDDLAIVTDGELIQKYLSTAKGAVWIELGCGDAKVTKMLAQELPDIQIFAYEVDEIQHDKNTTAALSDDCPKNLTFGKAGMQDFPAEDGSVDGVIMLKSLHHVPKELLKDGFAKVKRALKPGGKLFISEPVFGGAFNEILRIFHDEEEVRSHAFGVAKDQVESGEFALEEEIHCQHHVKYPRGFADFEERILGSTYNHFNLTNEVLETVKERFQEYVKENGSTEFMSPIRVDVLVKKSSF